MEGSARTQAQEWSSGWTLVLASAIGFSFFSVLLSAVGLFMEPLNREFGWDKSVLSAGPAIATGVTALLSPFYGAMIDRFGSRRLALPGIVITMAGTAMFGLADGSRTQWLLMWALFGLILTSIKSTIWTTAVAGVFEKGRGLALGIVVAGTAIAQTVVPPLGNWLIATTGWRGAFFWLSAGWGGLTLLLCWLFLYDAHDRHARAAASRGEEASARGSVSLPGLTKAQALRSPALWMVAASTFVVMLLTIGLGIHLFPILTESGVPRETAAWMMSLGGIAGVVGKLATGSLLDRFRPNWIGGLTMGVTAVTFFMLDRFIESTTAVIVAVVINGYAAGTKMQICAFLTVGFAGMRNFGSIYGVMSALVALGSGLGPFVAGRIYDTMGGYGPFLWLGVVGCTLGGALLILLPPYPRWQDGNEAKAFS
ncbi:MFS transporter [Novosphingobium album (ex Hu et al. 2023)]|uniref:MFS transporter n=1 Tax=Novosphingobium album (ex Hu et al. 2023) TaxID=2930093 RepID=A0ABT0B1K2_9SPHN|nr:MFS transporter [Novosphingobium album (ex Hu et al. 2023)]MCJ2178809.1 MFS transporter [Novosphingobium album (ex Hu et al. 2023)]